MIYYFTRKELKTKNASDFKQGDFIRVGKFCIVISYISNDGKRRYDRPSLCSYHWALDDTKCGCTPGADRPYYIDDFINR